MRVAIIHYWLVGMRGGERVLEAICARYPDADIYTHVYDPAATSAKIRRHRIHTTFINKLPWARHAYQMYLPLMPHALELLDLSGYDLVISSESGPAKGIVTHPNTLHVCYCHSPMRYLWDQYHTYHAQAGLLKRLFMSVTIPFLRAWDLGTASRVDHFIANSSFIAQRIQKIYRRTARVVFPPVDINAFMPTPQPRDDYYLAVGQFVPYKRMDLAVEALTRMGKRLVVVGSGSEEGRLRQIAGDTVTFRQGLSDAALAELYQNCSALIFSGEEDFGIIPLEAMACGRPVVAYGAGGALDTVLDGHTGILFAHQTVQHLTDAIARFEAMKDRFDPATIRRHAETFSGEVFAKEFALVIDELQRNFAAERAFMRVQPALGNPILPISGLEKIRVSA